MAFSDLTPEQQTTAIVEGYALGMSLEQIMNT